MGLADQPSPISQNHVTFSKRDWHIFISMQDMLFSAYITPTVFVLQ